MAKEGRNEIGKSVVAKKIGVLLTVEVCGDRGDPARSQGFVLRHPSSRECCMIPQDMISQETYSRDTS